MKTIKRILYKLFGREKYLFLVSKMFYLLYNIKFLKWCNNYNYHYFIKNLIKEGDCVIDLGANLGYYTILLSSLVGEKGRVIGVEPIAIYRKILEANIKIKNITIIPYALGDITGTVIMDIPTKDLFRHGLTKVMTSGECKITKNTFTVEIRKPSNVFKNLPKLNYIKCDIEGYEINVLPDMGYLIKEHKPIIQIEIKEANKEAIHKFLSELKYLPFYLHKKRLIQINNLFQKDCEEFIYIHKSKLKLYTKYIINK